MCYVLDRGYEQVDRGSYPGGCLSDTPHEISFSSLVRGRLQSGDYVKKRPT